MSANGRQYDWEDIRVILPQGQAIGITAIHYSDEQLITARYGSGSVPRGFGRGNYTATGSMILDRDEWERLKSELSKTGGIYDHTPFTVVVSYANNDMGEVTDTLNNCKIIRFTGGGANQGDANASPITCEFVILSPILWNGTPAK